MNSLEYSNSQLLLDGLSIEEIAQSFPTPFYIYSETELLDKFNSFLKAANDFKIKDPLICFALKANPNPALLKILFNAGAGADVVSGGELTRALENGCDPQKIVFSGVGNTEAKINLALDSHPDGIYSFNVESVEELSMIKACAKKKNKTARIAFRLNPHVHVKTHKHISTGFKAHKFGILKDDVLNVIKNFSKFPHTKIVGISVHIGSQLTCLKASVQAVEEVLELMHDSAIEFEFIDVGGGLGIDYTKEGNCPTPFDYMEKINSALSTSKLSHFPRVVFEPGRFISASAGLFVTKVIRTKKSDQCFFAIVDGGMNDFVRTSLYEAYHKIVPLKENDKKVINTEIVGPICETADSFATNYPIQELETDDLLAVQDTGAYGHSMSSNYNLRSRPKEIVIRSSKTLVEFNY